MHDQGVHPVRQYTDAESPLVYLRARYYGPATAQFLTVDPAVQQTLSAYGYGGGDPLDQTDPSGLWGWSNVTAFVRDHTDVISQINSVATAVTAVTGTVATGCAALGLLSCAGVAGVISRVGLAVTTTTEVALVIDKCPYGSGWDCGRKPPA